MGRLGPAPAGTDRRRLRPRCAARNDPARLCLRRVDAVAAIRGCLPCRNPHGVLRRRLPVISPRADRPRRVGGGKLEAAGDCLRRRCCRPRARRDPDPPRHCAIRDPRRRGQLRYLRGLHGGHQPPRSAPPRGRRASAGVGAVGKASGTLSGTAFCSRRRCQRAARISARTLSSRS